MEQASGNYAFVRGVIEMKRMSGNYSFAESFACIQMRMRNFIMLSSYIFFRPRRIKGVQTGIVNNYM